MDFESFSDLLTLIDQYKINFNVPRLIFVGIQSAGKTSLIECFIKNKIGYITSDIGTRRPIIYHLINSEKLSIKIICNEKTQEYDDFNLFYKDIEKLNNVEGISHDKITVKIYDKGLKNTIFMDLPGLRSNEENSDNKEKINPKIIDLIKENSEEKNSKVLLVVGATINFDTNSDFAYTYNLLKEKISSKKIVVVLNKFDMLINSTNFDKKLFLKNIKTIDFNSTHVVSSNPYGKNELSKDEYNNIFKRELEIYNNISFNDPNIKLGLIELEKEIGFLFEQMFKESLNELRNVIESKYTEKKERNKKIVEEYKNYSVENIINYMNDIIKRISERLNDIWTNRPFYNVEDISINDIPSYEIFGKTIEEDIEQSSFDWKIVNVEKKDILEKFKSNDYLNESSNNKLMGLSFISRLLKLFELIILNIKLTYFQATNIRNMNLNNGIINTPLIIENCLKQQLKKASHVFTLFKESIQEKVISYYNLLINEMRRNNEEFNELFIQDFCNIYSNYFTKLLHNIEERWKITIMINTNNISFDITSKTLISQILTIRTSTLIKTNIIEKNKKEDDKKIPKKDDKKEIKVDKQSSNNYINQDIQKLDENKIEIFNNKLDIMINLITKFRENEKNFDLTDYVSGGFQNIENEPDQLLNMGKILTLVYEYYFNVVDKILHDFRCSVRTFLDDEISNKMKDQLILNSSKLNFENYFDTTHKERLEKEMKQSEDELLNIQSILLKTNKKVFI